MRTWILWSHRRLRRLLVFQQRKLHFYLVLVVAVQL